MSLKQEVFLTIHDQDDKLVVDTTGLRVDFDVRHIDGFSRATFKIWNLNDETIKNVLTGERYVTVTTKLHGRNEFLVANKYFVSNGYDETKLPNNIVTLFCYDKLHKDLFDVELPDGGVTIQAPCTLKRIVAGIFASVGYTIAPTYLFFPDDLEALASPAGYATFDGSVDDAMAELAQEFEFKTYMEDGKVVLMYLPDLDNVDRTGISEAEVVTLRTDMMQSNPSIGPAILNVTSNLDSRLRPGKVLDVSQLLTISAGADEQAAQLADGYFKTGLAGFSRYQVLAVQHKGSNYTSEWFSNVTASAPTKGDVASTINWLNQ